MYSISQKRGIKKNNGKKGEKYFNPRLGRPVASPPTQSTDQKKKLIQVQKNKTIDYFQKFPT